MAQHQQYDKQPRLHISIHIVGKWCIIGLQPFGQLCQYHIVGVVYERQKERIADIGTEIYRVPMSLVHMPTGFYALIVFAQSDGTLGVAFQICKVAVIIEAQKRKGFARECVAQRVGPKGIVSATDGRERQ